MTQLLLNSRLHSVFQTAVERLSPGLEAPFLDRVGEGGARIPPNKEISVQFDTVNAVTCLHYVMRWFELVITICIFEVITPREHITTKMTRKWYTLIVVVVFVVLTKIRGSLFVACSERNWAIKQIHVFKKLDHPRPRPKIKKTNISDKRSP